MVLTAWLILLLSSNAWAIDWTQEADCEGAWLFTENTGTTVADASANTNTCTFLSAGNPAWASISGTGAPSYADYMVTFSSDYMDCGNDSSLLPANFTAMAWAYPTSNTGTTYSRVMEKGGYNSTSSERGGYGIEFNGTHDNEFYSTSWDQSGSATQTDTAMSYNLNQWYHIASTYNGSSLRIYVDGVLKDTATSALYNTNKNHNMFFGANNDTEANFFTGSVTESAVFSSALSATDINDIMDFGLDQSVAETGRTRRFFIIQ